MKKLITIVLSTIIIFSLTGCSNKQALDEASFKDSLESHNYSVTLTGEVDYEDLKSGAIASKDDVQISFFIFKSVNAAKQYYSDVKSNYVEEVTNNTQEHEENQDNYAKYYIYNNNFYKVVSRIDETIIIVETSPDKKEEITTVLEDINY